ncbi:hypothetical protein AVEN_118216-1 [Araneus ventricosus]|uniref:Uncharacterized protein n=1 Tax=Araneus ventricosus TaxID=182803 RepID=A0A4Y2PNF6_ARAVE|nr:hypothetical protein AVEN_118216-1 [Araneus ventricosus]
MAMISLVYHTHIYSDMDLVARISVSAGSVWNIRQSSRYYIDCRYFGLRLPGGKVAALGSEDYKFESRYDQRFDVYVGVLHFNTAGMVRNFGEGVARSCVVLVM